MVGIQGISGIREPASAKRADDRGKTDVPRGEVARDGVEISPEAERAAEAGRLLEQTQAQSQIRAERIAEAKQNLEQGTYRVQEVVLRVAARVSAYIAQSLS